MRRLAILAIVLAYLCAAIAIFSQQFAYGSPTKERPILWVLTLFAAMFVIYLLAIYYAARAPQTRRLLGLIMVTAVVARVVLLFSLPIQEIDIYRYLWDGAVTTAGISPFRYSPDQVRNAAADTALIDTALIGTTHPGAASDARESAPGFLTSDRALQQLVVLQQQQPALAEALHRIHFGELPTVYPPVSQAVFAAATLTTPTSASLSIHVLIMKAWLIGFDLATVVLVIGLLRMARLPVGLSVIYAWCPLVLKEVANSGHLDAIAVFWTTLAIYLTSSALVDGAKLAAHPSRKFWLSVGVTVALVLAVGAKLYPIVLTPLVLVVLLKRFGWQHFIGVSVVYAGLLALVFSPWLLPGSAPRPSLPSSPSVPTTTSAANASPVPIPPSTVAHDPSKGVRAFLGRWEMNDFIFLVLAENLRPKGHLSVERTAWFAVTPNPMRQSLAQRVATWCHIPIERAPFLTARALTAVAFMLIAITLAWRTASALRPTPASVTSFCAAAFLTLAWFWLLCPTQNPWYWTWGLPLLPLVRNRVWLAISGLVFCYYLRFWFGYHYPDPPVFGTRYAGHEFFDFVITWCEYAPWFVALAVSFLVRAKLTRSRTTHR